MLLPLLSMLLPALRLLLWLQALLRVAEMQPLAPR
jgi:hypothetical protein